MKSPIARSISTKLSAISRSRNVPYKNVLTEFLLERLLVRLTTSTRLSSHLIFKGGYVGRRAYGCPRYTIDLDALLKDARIGQLQNEIVQAVESDLKDGTWFRFERHIDLETQGEYPGIRFVFRTGLGEVMENQAIAQIVHFDVGVGDLVDAISDSIVPIIGGAEISWQVYSREIIVAEKLHACLTRPVNNSRSKDIFDLFFYLPECDSKHLSRTIKRTFELRGTPAPINVSADFKSINTRTLRRGWSSAVSGIPDAADFDDIFFQVVRLLEDKLY